LAKFLPALIYVTASLSSKISIDLLWFRLGSIENRPKGRTSGAGHKEVYG
jgi:hypothetical protein